MYREEGDGGIVVVVVHPTLYVVGTKFSEVARRYTESLCPPKPIVNESDIT